MFTRILRLSAALCLYAVWQVATAHAQFCVPPPSGIVSWWPANGDATDFFGANNGTLEGGAIATAPGEVNTAFQFDGTNGFVQIPNSAALEPTNLTVEAWVLFNSLNSAENSAPGHQYIVFKQNSRSSNFEGYDLGKQRSGGADHFYFLVASSSGTEIQVDSTNAITTNVWYHLAGVRGSNYIQLYVNGQVQGQATVNFPQDYGHLPLYFGSTGQSYWDGKLAGKLDEVSLYNRPLSSNEIYGIYLAGGAGKCIYIHYVNSSSTNPVSPFSTWATAATNIQDAIDASSAGDQVLVSNGVYQTGSRLSSDGAQNRVVVTNSITVQAVNGPSVTIINGLNAVRCVNLDSGAVLTGFTLTGGNAPSGGGAYGGTLNNCLLSGNSAEYGGGAYSCTANNCALNNNSALGTTAYFPAYGGAAYGCTLVHCTLSGNSASCNNGGSTSGGGAYLSTLENCTLSGNSAQYGGGEYYCTANNCTLINNTANGTPGLSYGFGGGGYGGMLNNCILTGNSANGLPGAGFYYGIGGGAYASTLNNCTLINNSATGNYLGQGSGGGAYGCTLDNCIVYYNSAVAVANANYYSCTLNDCCTTPLPSSGTGNITSAPLFVNQAGGDYHLQAGSPCIDAGNNSYVVNLTDFDGRPRIVNQIVDIGAYEFQGPFDSWLQQYGLATNGAADFIDTDGDGMNNYQEYIAGTNPTNRTSVLVITSAVSTNAATGITVSWQSVNTRNYFIQRASDLTLAPAFQPLATNIPGQTGTTSYTDTNAPTPGPYYYRVGVQTQ